ncbi:BT4734/BF3469 family protein [Pedobacter glucosidilyticus]|uniref:BT4734/BF3469 family protein n=1 Tax=Pedobacter glucosidilyticus TaxID=1122941 RepID=UPI000411B099|nr:BT4734/BF3469 family protein [Pedobacter glucosidilyticus]
MEISKFEKIHFLKPIATIHPLEPFLDMGCKDIIESIRAEPIEDIQKLMKTENLPAFTASGTFSPTRNEASLKKHSGCIAFDIDKLKAFEVDPLKRLLKDDPFVYACSLSARGKGLCGLFKISEPAFHKKHFAAMERYFLMTYHVKLDPAPSNVASGRFYSYDANPFINEKSKIFEYLYDEPKKPKNNYSGKSNSYSVADDFNIRGGALIEELLIEHGWAYIETKGTNNRYTRPGKTSGISANYCSERKLFFVWSTDPDTGLKVDRAKAFNHWAVFVQLECNGDQKEAARKLYALGYGNPLDITPHVEAPEIIDLSKLFNFPFLIPANSLEVKICDEILTPQQFNQILT